MGLAWIEIYAFQLFLRRLGLSDELTESSYVCAQNLCFLVLSTCIVDNQFLDFSPFQAFLLRHCLFNTMQTLIQFLTAVQTINLQHIHRILIGYLEESEVILEVMLVK